MVCYYYHLDSWGGFDDIGLTIVSSEIRLYGFKESRKPRYEWRLRIEHEKGAPGGWPST